jgi:hypothetical protein
MVEAILRRSGARQYHVKGIPTSFRVAGFDPASK